MAEDKKITIDAEEVIQMMDETSRLVVDENASRLSSMGFSARESDMLTNDIGFWNWLNQNYAKSRHFASAENAMEYVSGSANQRKWVEKTVQGKGYEWDWMSDQRHTFKNIFKRYDAGTVANRSASDVTEIDALTGQSTEYQMKAYRSSNTPELKNTPKDMAVVTNAEKVDPVKNKGYKNVISYKDNDTIKQATDQRMQQIESGKADPTYNLSNVGPAIAKAGIFGFVLCAGTETIVSYRKWHSGEITGKEYLKEIMKSGGDAGVTASFSTGLMIPISAAITTAGMSSVITIPMSFVISAGVNKVVAPAFARGDYLKELNEARYYQSMNLLYDDLTRSMDQAAEKYCQFVASMVKQQHTFRAIRGDAVPSQHEEDFEYYAQQPKEDISLMVSCMIALMQDSDTMLDKMKNQGFFKRMVFTVLGRNKVTVKEIKLNKDKLDAYMTKAISVLFERQCIDERVIQILGDQINEIAITDVQLNRKINSVENLGLLLHEIDLGEFNETPPIVAICIILSQLDARILSNGRALKNLQMSLNKQKILSADTIDIIDLLLSVISISEKDIPVVYAELSTIKSNKFADMMLSLIDGTYLNPDRMQCDKENIVLKVAEKYSIEKSYDSTSLNEVYSSLLETIREETQQAELAAQGVQKALVASQVFQQAEELFYAGRLTEAYPKFIQAADESVSRAFYYLAEYYENEYGNILEDATMVRMYRKKGMEHDDLLSTFKYGYLIYEFEDQKKGLQWQEKYLKDVQKLADSGDPIAAFEYGYALYLHNSGNTENTRKFIQQYQKAKRYFKKAIDKGYWPAAYYGCQLLIDPSGKSTPEDLLSKYSWLFANVEWYLVHTFLGRKYLTIDMVHFKFYKNAAQCFMKALSLRDDLKEAAAYLAFMLNTGKIEDSLKYGISKKNIEMYYKAGLECDNALVLIDVGSLYSHGVGSDKLGADVKKALQCYEKGYALYDEKAIPEPMQVYKKGNLALVLACMYLAEADIETNAGKAVKYFKEAVDLGETRAIKHLADCYLNGIGTKKDKAKYSELMSRISHM